MNRSWIRWNLPILFFERSNSIYGVLFPSLLGIFSNCCTNILFITAKNPVYLAAFIKLLFLYLMECQICTANFVFNNRYLSVRPAPPTQHQFMGYDPKTPDQQVDPVGLYHC